MRPTYRDPAYTRYLKRFIPAMLLYVGAIVLASTLIPDHAKASRLTVGIALLPGLACIAMIWAMALNRNKEGADCDGLRPCRCGDLGPA